MTANDNRSLRVETRTLTRTDEIAQFCADGKTYNQIMFKFMRRWDKSEGTVAKAIATAGREGRIKLDKRTKEYTEVKE